MFGKHFSSMYEGSMRGAGSAFFAVWGYVISHMMPCRGAKGGTRVELNPEVIAFLIGEKNEVVVEQIGKMCSPDPKSRTKVEGGRRLIKLGEYEYRVVNGDKYRAIRDEETRRQQNRDAKARQRLNERLRAGGTLAQAVKEAVREDPITQRDKESLRVLAVKEDAEQVASSSTEGSAIPPGIPLGPSGDQEEGAED